MMATLISLFWSVFLLTLVVRILVGIVGISEGAKFLDRALAALLFVALGAPLLQGALQQAAHARPAVPLLSDVGAPLTTATSFVAVVVVVGHVLFLGVVLFLRRRLAARRSERERVVRGRERVTPRAEDGGRR